jgi:hypothetical protein
MGGLRPDQQISQAHAHSYDMHYRQGICRTASPDHTLRNIMYEPYVNGASLFLAKCATTYAKHQRKQRIDAE